MSRNSKYSGSFILCFNRLMEFEGGYVNPKEFPEGETYCGILRKDHKLWRGWALIDHVKTASDFPEGLKDIKELQFLVKDFYWNNCWFLLDLEFVSTKSVNIAFEILKMSVHMSKNTSISIFQHALNLMNRNGTLYENIKADGILGPKTLRALHFALRLKLETRLVFMINILQGCFYVSLWDMNEDREAYVSWLNRLETQKNMLSTYSTLFMHS